MARESRTEDFGGLLAVSGILGSEEQFRPGLRGSVSLGRDLRLGKVYLVLLDLEHPSRTRVACSF